MNLDFAGHLERRPDVCGGALVIEGTRVSVRTLLASLAEGATEEEVRADFLTVTPMGLRAVIAFAAAAAADDLSMTPVPHRLHAAQAGQESAGINGAGTH